MQLSKFISKLSTISYSKFLENNRHVSENSNFFNQKKFPFHYHYLFKSKKKELHIQRFFFFGLSILFILLGFFLYFKTYNFNQIHLFIPSDGLKRALEGICLIASASSFSIGWWSKPEQEAWFEVAHRLYKDSNKTRIRSTNDGTDIMLIESLIPASSL